MEQVLVNREWDPTSNPKKGRPTVRFVQVETKRGGVDLDLLTREPKNRNERRARERELKKLPFTEISKKETAPKDPTKTCQTSMNTTAD